MYVVVNVTDKVWRFHVIQKKKKKKKDFSLVGKDVLVYFL